MYISALLAGSFTDYCRIMKLLNWVSEFQGEQLLSPSVMYFFKYYFENDRKTTSDLLTSTLSQNINYQQKEMIFWLGFTCFTKK